MDSSIHQDASKRWIVAQLLANTLSCMSSATTTTIAMGLLIHCLNKSLDKSMMIWRGNELEEEADNTIHSHQNTMATSTSLDSLARAFDVNTSKNISRHTYHWGCTLQFLQTTIQQLQLKHGILQIDQQLTFVGSTILKST